MICANIHWPPAIKNTGGNVQYIGVTLCFLLIIDKDLFKLGKRQESFSEGHANGDEELVGVTRVDVKGLYVAGARPSSKSIKLERSGLVNILDVFWRKPPDLKLPRGCFIKSLKTSLLNMASLLIKYSAIGNAEPGMVLYFLFFWHMAAWQYMQMTRDIPGNAKDFTFCDWSFECW